MAESDNLDSPFLLTCHYHYRENGVRTQKGSSMPHSMTIKSEIMLSIMYHGAMRDLH